MTAAGRWAAQLEAWAIPQELLDSVDESPYGWPQALWARRSELARAEADDPPTTRIVAETCPAGGTLLDVGAGRGRASFPVAAADRRLIAVEPDAAMVAGLREEARLASLDVRVVEGRWPDVVDEVGRVDVAMCANVVYDVADLAPFLSSLQRVATRGVVVELTAAHPWANLAPYYRRLHDLDRPDGPSVDDFVAVVREVIDIDPIVESWSRAGRVWFADWDELLALQRRRLVLTPDRDDELRRVLEPDVEVRDGRLYLGGSARTMATVWWPGASVRHA